jgi:hypothetical protein
MKKAIILLVLLAGVCWGGFRGRYQNTENKDAVITVAASDSPTVIKAQADYVCDGVADDVEIQAAIAKLGTQGGEVVCSQGNYVFASSVLIGASNITLKFQPGSSVKIVATGHSLDAAINNTDSVSYLVHASGRDNVKIIGMNMDWEAGADQTKFLTNTNYAGIWLHNCTNSVIQDCNVQNVVRNVNTSNRAWGILVSDCDKFLIDNCIANTCGYEGIGVREASKNGVVQYCRGMGSYSHLFQASGWAPTINAATGMPQNILVTHCITGPELTDDLMTHGSSGGGLKNISFIANVASRIKVIGDVDNCIVTDNTITSSLYSSAQIYINNTPTAGMDATCKNILIANNNISKNANETTAPGLTIAPQLNSTTGGSIQNITITGNIFRNAPVLIGCEAGINTGISDVTFSDNVFVTDCPTSMSLVVFDADSAITVSRIAFLNNQFLCKAASANSYGFRFDGAAVASLLNDLTIKGNSFTFTTSGTKRVIYTQALAGPVVTGLYFDDNYVSCAGTILYNAYTATPSITKVRMSNNIFDDIVTLTSTTNAGQTTDVVVKNNRFNDTAFTVGTNITVTMLQNEGYVTENSGTSTGTGAQQTIAHGLSAVPTRVYFSNIDDGANAYQSAAADATNIYVTAVNEKDYVWSAEVK